MCVSSNATISSATGSVYRTNVGFHAPTVTRLEMLTVGGQTRPAESRLDPMLE
jgi:hypothetical protein